MEKLARGALDEARRVLQAHRAGLRALAEALLLQETLDGAEAEAVVREAVTGPALAAAD